MNGQGWQITDQGTSWRIANGIDAVTPYTTTTSVKVSNTTISSGIISGNIKYTVIVGGIDSPPYDSTFVTRVGDFRLYIVHKKNKYGEHWYYEIWKDCTVFPALFADSVDGLVSICRAMIIRYDIDGEEMRDLLRLIEVIKDDPILRMFDLINSGV